MGREAAEGKEKAESRLTELEEFQTFGSVDDAAADGRRQGTARQELVEGNARETGTAGLLSTVLAARAKWCFFPDA